MRNLSQSLGLKLTQMPYRLLFLSFLIALFAGCATPPKPIPQAEVKPEPVIGAEAEIRAEEFPGTRVETMVLPPAVDIEVKPELAVPDTSALEQMATEGRFLDAALAYVKLAAGHQAPLSERYTLRAAELLTTGNYIPQSFQLLQDLGQETLPAELEIRRSILRARIALARKNPQQALQHLGSESFSLTYGEPGLLIAMHRLRATAYEQLGQHLETARERIALEILLSDSQVIAENQQAILQNLGKLPLKTIQALHTGAAHNIFNGWLELAVIHRADNNIRQSNELLATWRKRYPQHPVLDLTLDAILAARPPVTPLPEQIALILPLDNRFAKAAAAVRDGFFAAYYAHLKTIGPDPIAGSYIPRINIYAEGNNPALINSVVNQAVNEGAQFIIGPLNKEAVNQLAQRESLPVPTLALNFSEATGRSADTEFASTQSNFYQMSLSPEQEARQVAERAWLDGQVRVAIIRPNTSWGKRVSEAFASRWKEIGGDIVETRDFDANKSDYSLPIRQLLNVDESEQRNNALRRILGQKLEFTPRRRQDVDFIFMAASSRQARLIRPQLRFHHAIDLPVYATSHSFSGTINANVDRDMDGVLFSDIPWTLDPGESALALRKDIEQNWPDEAKLYSRLYALGVDAYQLIGKLPDLDRDPASFFAGQTGNLYLDLDNRLQRRLIWAEFQRGIPRVIDNF